MVEPLIVPDLYLGAPQPFKNIKQKTGGDVTYIYHAETRHVSLRPEGPCELDSQADTCCAGFNCTIIEYTNRTCSINGYNRNDPSGGIPDIPIVKAATAYDAPTGKTYIIVIPQALYLGEYIDYSLLRPNQLRHHGVIVDDVP